MPSPLIITATDAGFYTYNKDTAPFRDAPDFWGFKSSFSGGRYHLHSSDPRWMNEIAHDDPYYDVVATLSATGFQSLGVDQFGTPIGTVSITGTTVSRLEGETMIPVATVTVDEITMDTRSYDRGGIYIDEGETASWIANIGLALRDYAGANGLVFQGSDAYDNLTFSIWDDDLTAGTEIYLERGDDVVRATPFDDSIEGGWGDDTIWGYGGNDTIHGDRGDDNIIVGLFADRHGIDASYVDGGHGQDNIQVLSEEAGGIDTVNGGGGRDTISGSDRPDSLLGGLGKDLIFGDDGDDTIRGGKWNDTLIGDQGADAIDGDEGNDSIRGGLGDDTIRGGTGNNYLFGDEDDDRIIGYDGNDQLNGGDDNDFLLGDGGNDTLSGDSGDDRLDGGLDADTLNGGPGDDVLWYDDLADSGPGVGNRDYVRGFQQGEDVLHLKRLDADSTTSEDDGFVFIGAAAFSGTSGELRYAHIGGETIVQADVDGDQLPDFEIAINSVLTLEASDFVL